MRRRSNRGMRWRWRKCFAAAKRIPNLLPLFEATFDDYHPITPAQRQELQDMYNRPTGADLRQLAGIIDQQFFDNTFMNAFGVATTWPFYFWYIPPTNNPADIPVVGWCLSLIFRQRGITLT